MKLSQMRYFSAVCHLGGITRAAERLHISQPAVTAAIQSLEDELGVLLLSRGGRTLVPTPDGETFLARCDSILEEVDGLTADFQALSRRRTTLSVGVPPMVAFFLFPKIFAEFTGSHPEVRIRLTEAGSDTARDMVRSGQLDLAIIAMGETPPAALEAQLLLRTPMMYCTGPDTPMANRERAELRDIAAAPLILFTSVGYWNEYFQGLVLSSGEQHYPLQTYIKQMVVNIQTTNLSMDQIEKMDKLSNQSLDAAKVFIAMVPMLVVYPFLQKYFINGIMLGAVKE